MKTRILSILAFLTIVVTSAVAQEPATYKVTMKEGTVDADKWTITPAEAATTGVAAGTPVTATYSGMKKLMSLKAVKKETEEIVTLETPLTVKVTSAGSVNVNIGGELSTGMKYAVNGGDKTTITQTTLIENLKVGDKVRFYGNGTSTQVYGDIPEVKISGGTAEVMVYGNIMSLLDETGYATLTALPQSIYVFYGLFKDNAKLTDASGLLLPATTLANSCYAKMFQNCTALTAAPELPATTLTTGCYTDMFSGCSKLASVKCLATTGINPNSSTFLWLSQAGSDVTGDKYVYTVSTANWTENSDSGIPFGWTRQNIDN